MKNIRLLLKRLIQNGGGIKEALHENDIEIVFADEEYIRKKYQEK